MDAKTMDETLSRKKIATQSQNLTPQGIVTKGKKVIFKDGQFCICFLNKVIKLNITNNGTDGHNAPLM